MARYVLLEFDDNDEANNFVNMFRPVQIDANNPSIRVRAIFFKPTQFCECPNPGDKQARGRKFNLWIHAGCGKPMRGHVQHPRNLLTPQEEWDEMDSRKKSSFYLGIREGIEL